jgi:hypothetical protein
MLNTSALLCKSCANNISQPQMYVRRKKKKKKKNPARPGTLDNNPCDLWDFFFFFFFFCVFGKEFSCEFFV